MNGNEQAERIAALRSYVETKKAVFHSKPNKEFVAKIFCFGVWNGLTGNRSWLFPSMTASEATRFLEAQLEEANQSDVAFNFCKRIAAYHVLENVQMPPFLAEFTGHVLLGDICEPPPRPASEGHMLMRDWAIWELVNKARTLGAPTQQIAYDEVSELLLDFGLRANNPSTIKKKYLSFRRMVADNSTANHKT